jgi:hypothetical protein
MSTEPPLRCVPPDIQTLFGDPPVLSTEDVNVYWEMLDRFAGFVQPRNILEWFWVKDIVDLCWEINRLRHLRSQLIENELPKENTEIEEDGEDGEDGEEADDADAYSAASAEDTEERENAPTLDIGGHRSFRVLLENYQAIDKLITSAEMRRDRIFRELELRRERIAPLLRKASNQMIEDRSGEITLVPK